MTMQSTRVKSKLAVVTASVVGMVALLDAKPALAHPGHGGVFVPQLVQQNLTPSLILTGFCMAFLFGAGHAIAPGHGKTMVAAYLVGSRGTPKQALLLGLVTTITHTLGVFALGILALFATQYVLPEQLYPVLSFISGLTVCSVGFWLLDSRLNNSEDDDSQHHHNHMPEEAPQSSLIALGVASGIVPCPSALVALHQTAYGMLLLSAFSLGLASVLITLGLSVVYASLWFDRLPTFGVKRQHLGVVSAVAIIVTGVTLTAVAVI